MCVCVWDGSSGDAKSVGEEATRDMYMLMVTE